MKKITLLSLLGLLAAGASANPITPQKAMQLAQEFMVPGHTMNMQVKAQARRAQAQSQSSPYYIISRGDNQGFVIVSGDDCLPEVLGYTEQGNFDAATVPPALQDMLDYWQMSVEQAQETGTNVTLAKARRAPQLYAAGNKRVDIAPFVTSHWHQSSPYNDNCPTLTKNGSRALTGCVATAASQILYYWRKDLPSTLQASTPTYGYGDAPVTRSVPKGTPLKWDLMKDQYGSEPAEYKQAVAEFVFATGAATWLTYGSSTSGNIEKIPYTFSAYFGMNGGTVKYRNSYTQEQWNQLIYDELAQGRPVMYTGVHPSNGGHAVFVHGYQASTDRVYFNFGWGDGNGYDGWYTTDQTTGMNGFYDSQSCLIGAYPKKSNLAAKVKAPAKVVANAVNDFTVTFTNNSTLPYSGVYIFVSQTAVKPASLGAAKSKDTETVIPVGASKTMSLGAAISGEKDWYITVTDKSLNILAQIPVTSNAVESDITLKGLEVNGSSDTEMLGDEAFCIAYNTSTTITATFANNSAYPYSNNLKLNVYGYNADTKEWEQVGYKTMTVSAKGGETVEVPVSMISLALCPIENDRYYRAVFDTADSDAKVEDEANGMARFILHKGNGMSVVSFTDNVLTLKGQFDQTQFNSIMFAKRANYSKAAAYDLRQCTGVGHVFQDVNPNALYYVSDDSQAEGVNVIKNGVCHDLRLISGYDFKPMTDFTAEHASLQIAAQSGKWFLMTCPFDAPLNPDMMTMDITGHNSIMGIMNNTKLAESIAAGRTYIAMAAEDGTLTIDASDCHVSASPVANPDASFIGTYSTVSAPASVQLINNDDTQYFEPVAEGTEIAALSGYFLDAKTTRKFRAFGDITADPQYVNLAKSINLATAMLKQMPLRSADETGEKLLAALSDAKQNFAERKYADMTAIKQACADIDNLLSAYILDYEGLKDVEIDYTSCIKNPSFESKSATGWTVGTREGVSKPGAAYVGTSYNAYRGVGLDGSYLFQSLIVADKDSTSVGLSQEVTGLKPGYYRLTAKVGTSAGKSVTMYAGDSEVTVDAHAFGGLYLTDAVIEGIKVEAAEGESTGTLTIGIKEGAWYKADDFRLTFVEGFPYDDPTAIEVIHSTSLSPQRGIYTIGGQRISKVTAPGLYIINGKKTLVK